MKVLAIIAAVLVALYAAWGWIYPSGTLRYRLNVEVEVDGKIHTGSGVIEARYEIPPRWLLGANRVVTSARGEAVVVDLGARGLLFVLLTGAPSNRAGGYSAHPTAMPVKEFFGISVGGLEETTVRNFGRLVSRAEVPPDRLPMLVTFKDINDPRSVVQVRPDDLEAAFGPGVRLGRVTIEATRHAVTTGIEKIVPVLMAELREEARVSRIERRGEPFRVNSSQFERSR